MSSLTIAHVLSSFGLGGQERVALDLATAQHAAGHRVIAVSLAAPPDGPLADCFRAAGIQTDTVAKRGGFDISLPLRLAKRLGLQRIDVVHTHNPHALIYGAPAAALLRAVAVHSKHGINPDTARRMRLRRIVSRVVDAYVAVTPTLARIAQDNRECKLGRLHVIPNGIDVESYAPNAEARSRVRAELGIPEDAWVVGTVGRLAPEKNQGLLVDAMTDLLGERRHLVIVGDGPERESLASRVAATGRGQFVHLTGVRSDVAQLLSAFDVFALTSKSEGLPLVLLEAMATGLVVVSTKVGGIGDIVEHGVTGFLITPGDSEAFSEQLRWLSARPTAALEAAEIAQRMVRGRYSMQRMAREYEALYKNILARRTRANVHAVAEAAGE